MSNTGKAGIIAAIIAAAGGGVLVTELINDEGVKLAPYSDSLGHKTIGVGHLVKDGESFKSITPEKAGFLLAGDIKIAENELNNVYPRWRELDDVRQRAMLNLMFNLGEYRFSKMKTFLAAMDCKDYHHAANTLKRYKWCKQVGRRCPIIVEMIRNGKR